MKQRNRYKQFYNEEDLYEYSRFAKRLNKKKKEIKRIDYEQDE